MPGREASNPRHETGASAGSEAEQAWTSENKDATAATASLGRDAATSDAAQVATRCQFPTSKN